MIQNRSVATNLVVTILTCGIYGIFWMVSITDDVARVNKEQTVSGGIAFLLSLVTCGIYGIYWNYRMPQLIYRTEVNKKMPATDNSIVCLLLSIFGFGLISYCIIQSELNRLADSEGQK